MSVHVGIVGATGLVGEIFLKLLEERRFPVGKLRLFASENSRGLNLPFGDRALPVESLHPGCFDGLDLVFFSSGDEVSRTWAPQAAAAGAWAIDNSAAFRRNDEVPLVVPEVNFHDLRNHRGRIVANPNCTTIQLVVALYPILKEFGLERVQVASYQAVSGAGRAAQQEMLAQQRAELEGQAPTPARELPHTIAGNVIPQIGNFDAAGLCSEEGKVVFETKKILQRPGLSVSAFTVRVPVLNGHAEAVWVQTEKTASAAGLRDLLARSEGITVVDDPSASTYPLPRNASGQDAVFVGRIAEEPSWPRTLRLWIVADNLRKGAALNAIQIAERLFK
jgi:aspartate-semialdehyde dehydrogenase